MNFRKSVKIIKRNGSGVAQSKFQKTNEFNGQFTDMFTKAGHNQVPSLHKPLAVNVSIIDKHEKFHCTYIAFDLIFDNRFYRPYIPN